MADETPTPEAAEATAVEEVPKKGRSKLLLIGGLVVVLAAGGGGAWFFLGGAHAKKDAAEEEADEGHAERPAVGALVALDPFVANLADEDGKRYLKATLQVEFFDASAPKVFDEREAQMRDLLLTLFTSKMFSEIRTPAGKAVLRDEIINRLNRALDADLVKAVYFTEFIVQ